MRARRGAAACERKTVAYVRVSTEDQANNGVSIDAQAARIAAYCTAMGFAASEVIRDAGASAKSLQRPGMEQILVGVRGGSIGRIIVFKLDRLTRSTRDLAELLDLFSRHNTALVSVCEHLDTETAAGRMVVNMLAVVAQWEREAIAERTAFALAHKRRQRTVYAPTPFGFRREGATLIEEPEEQAALADAHRMDVAGRSYREIAAMLTARGVKPHRGRAWHASTVRAMLRSRIAQEAADSSVAAQRE